MESLLKGISWVHPHRFPGRISLSFSIKVAHICNFVLASSFQLSSLNGDTCLFLLRVTIYLSVPICGWISPYSLFPQIFGEILSEFLLSVGPQCCPLAVKSLNHLNTEVFICINFMSATFSLIGSPLVLVLWEKWSWECPIFFSGNFNKFKQTFKYAEKSTQLDNENRDDGKSSERFYSD